MAGLSVRDLGEYIRQQRRAAQVSVRQLARLAGVSNPYLSQIERGLRKPSAEILQQIARALRISAETLYVQAGILDEREGAEEVITAIRGDDGLTERQKRVLLDIYASFREENARASADSGTSASSGPSESAGTSPEAAAPTPPSAAAAAPAAAPDSPRDTDGQQG